MTFNEFHPCPALQPLVKSYWLLEGRGQEEPQQIFPDGTMEVAFHFGDPFHSVRNGRIAEPQPSSLLIGQMLEPTWVAPGRTTGVLGIRFQPGGMGAFFAAPASEFTGRIADLQACWPRLHRQLVQMMTQWRNWPQRIAALERALLCSLLPRADFAILRTAKEIEDGPSKSMDNLAADAGLSARQFRRRFLDATGAGPKTFHRVTRFNRALRTVESAANLAQAALDAGYSDQAHMVHDFRAFAGLAPSQTVDELTGISRVFLRPL